MVTLRGETTYPPTSGAAKTTRAFDRKQALVTLVEGIATIQVTNPHNLIYTLDSCVALANFKVMTPNQAANTKANTGAGTTDEQPSGRI